MLCVSTEEELLRGNEAIVLLEFDEIEDILDNDKTGFCKGYCSASLRVSTFVYICFLCRSPKKVVERKMKAIHIPDARNIARRKLLGMGICTFIRVFPFVFHCTSFVFFSFRSHWRDFPC